MKANVFYCSLWIDKNFYKYVGSYKSNEFIKICCHNQKKNKESNLILRKYNKRSNNNLIKRSMKQRKRNLINKIGVC